MPAFHIAPTQIHDETIEFGQQEVHHLHVRRIRPGDVIDVLDGEGASYRVRVETLNAETATAVILESFVDAGESPYQLQLAVAMIKGQRFDTVVEKATEIGVCAIQPLLTTRGVVKGEGKTERWERVARAAAKQCGRSRIPLIYPSRSLQDVAADAAAQGMSLLVADPAAADPLAAVWPDGCDAATLFVGAEGGLTGQERACLAAHGASSFVWGNRVLRADTAAIVLSALVLDHGLRAMASKAHPELTSSSIPSGA